MSDYPKVYFNNFDLTNWPFMAIYDSVKDKNPRNDVTITKKEFIRQFEEIALENHLNVTKLLKDNKKNKVKINALKIKAPCWRPNAIYGNRHEGCKEERVIMGSGLYAFDIDFEEDWSFKRHQDKLDKFKEIIFRDCESVFAVYKSFSMTGLHIIIKGLQVADAKSYRQMWSYEMRKLKRDFKFVKIDEKAKDITRALFIGSDDKPLFNLESDYQDLKEASEKDKNIYNMIKDRIINLPTELKFEFAKIQCMVKPSFIKDTKDRFIRLFVTYDDLDETMKKRISKLYNDIINVKSGEDYSIEAYLLDTGKAIFLPRFYLGGDGFIPVGRRRSTLVSFCSKFLYLNGYWLCDAIPLVKKHFDDHYFERFEQRKGEQFSKDEMFSVIDSCLKDMLLPTHIDARTSVDGKPNKKQNFNKKNVFIDQKTSELSRNQSAILTKKYSLKEKIKKCKQIAKYVYMVHGKDVSIKELYYKAQSLWEIMGYKTLESFRQFKHRNNIDLTYLHIIKTLSNKNIYVEPLNETTPVPKRTRR